MPGDEVVFWRESDHVAVRHVRSERPLKGRFLGRRLLEALEGERAAERRRGSEQLTITLDSWAVLALLEGREPAASLLSDVLDRQWPTMSWINLGEVYYVVRRKQGEAEAREVVHDLEARLDLDLPSESRILAAAGLKADHPIAHADAFAAATAVAHDAVLLTGDPELLRPRAPWRWGDLRR